MAATWPTYENGDWKYHTTPILDNFRPLPGRVTDNQQRWVQETVELVPWFKELYDEWVEKQEMSEKSEQEQLQWEYEKSAVRKLCSTAYSPNWRKTLLKIMAMPLMEHEQDIFNDGVRVAALTIDIRYDCFSVLRRGGTGNFQNRPGKNRHKTGIPNFSIIFFQNFFFIPLQINSYDLETFGGKLKFEMPGIVLKVAKMV